MSAVRMPIDTLIIIYASREYDTFHRRCLIEALAASLPERWAVLCVDRPLTLDMLVRKRPRWWFRARRQQRPRQLADSLFLFRPRLLAHELIADRCPGLPRVHRFLMRRQLRSVVRELFGDVHRTISWISSPVQQWAWDLLPNEKTVYECYDEYGLNPDGTLRPRVQEKEKHVLGRADIAFVTAERMVPRRRPLAERVVYLSNGVPASFLAAAEADRATMGGRRPRIGYLGHFYEFMATDLLVELCRSHPEWDFTFAGLVPDGSSAVKLRALSNVTFPGRLPYSEVPEFLQRLEVALIPFELTEYVLATNPLKTYEYMAAGIPIVASDLPELRRFGHVIRLVENTPEAFATAIKETLASDRDHLRRQLLETARQFTWDHLCRTVVVPELLRLASK